MRRRFARCRCDGRSLRAGPDYPRGSRRGPPSPRASAARGRGPAARFDVETAKHPEAPPGSHTAPGGKATAATLSSAKLHERELRGTLRVSSSMRDVLPRADRRRMSLRPSATLRNLPQRGFHRRLRPWIAQPSAPRPVPAWQTAALQAEGARPELPAGSDDISRRLGHLDRRD